jgi:hypothetical protein
MSPGHIPIGEVPLEICARARWWERVRQAAPLVSPWTCHIVAHLLARADASPDFLLSMAEAFDEASNFVAINGETELAAQLRRLADFPRDLAPRRAKQET